MYHSAAAALVLVARRAWRLISWLGLSRSYRAYRRSFSSP